MEKTMKKYFPLFVLPTLVAFLIAFVVPFVMGVYLSFCEFTTVTNAKFVGTANYIKAFSNQDFESTDFYGAVCGGGYCDN